MTTRDLTPEQQARFRAQIGRQLRYLSRLLQRMDQTGWSPTDPVRLAVFYAWEGVYSLIVKLHYAMCPPGTVG